jgi:hypothetical protein
MINNTKYLFFKLVPFYGKTENEGKKHLSLLLYSYIFS